MEITKVKDYWAMSETAKDLVLARIGDSLVIALPTGKTPEGLYSLLVEEYRRGKADFSAVTTFNLDEYVGLNPANQNSYHFYMKKNFLKHVNIKKSHIPDGMAKDLDKECAEYEKKIESAGGIDLAILGIGRNGHIGFNEPGTASSSRTHVVYLSPETQEANSRFFEGEVPKRAITMGIGTIMGSKEIILLASGEEKAEAVWMMSEGAAVPAAILKEHPNCVAIIDRKASLYTL